MRATRAECAPLWATLLQVLVPAGQDPFFLVLWLLDFISFLGFYVLLLRVLVAGLLAWLYFRKMGARALGNRSILASPLNPYSTENLNLFIKHREPFRKFAASVPAELAAEFFEVGPNARFLATVGKVRPEHRKTFASALLGEGTRALLDGVELADSLVWDAHKLMRTPTLCAAVLLRDARDLDGAFKQEASYLFHDKEQPGVDFIHRTVECTKAGLGLRFFAVLAALGEEGLARYVQAGHRSPARGWPQQPAKDPYGRRFTGAVGSQKAQDLAFLELEADVLDQFPLVEVFHFQDRRLRIHFLMGCFSFIFRYNVTGLIRMRCFFFRKKIFNGRKAF